MYTYISVRNKVSEEFLFNNTGWIVSPDLDGDSMYDFNVRYAWKVIAAVTTAVVVTDSCLLLGPPGSNWCFSFAPQLVGYSAPRDLHRRAAYSVCESWFLIHQDVYHDLFVCS